MAIEAIGFNPGIWQFLDENGAPYAGGSLTFVQVGTSTAQDVYSDAALTVSLGNVVTLNAAGRTSTSSSGPDTAVYFQQKTYDVTLKNSSGTSIWGPVTFSGSQWPGQIQGQAILSPAANANGYTNRFTTTINKASSGVHALFAGSRFDIPTIGAGASSLTEASTVYIEGAPATGTTKYAFHVAAGTSLFSGPIDATGGFANAQFAGICNGRLTLTSGTPVTTADVTGATTVYFTPYAGNTIGVYDGSANWNLLTFSEISVALGTLTSGLPYDLFVYNNAGTLALRNPVAWTNTTTRATALTTQDGVYVKNGATTDRYVGSFFTTATTTTEDSAANRYLYNYYNRVGRQLLKQDSTSTWPYTLDTFRQARATATNQVAVLQGVAEGNIDVTLVASFSNSTNNSQASVAIGEDSTTTPVTGGLIGTGISLGAVVGSSPTMTWARLTKTPAVGKHVYVWLEASQAAGTTTWVGQGTGGLGVTNGIQSGLTGTWAS